MLQLENYESELLRVWTAKLWEMRDKNMPALQAFLSTHSSWFTKLVIMDGSIRMTLSKNWKISMLC